MRYCGQCGARLDAAVSPHSAQGPPPRAALPGEIKQVTVLFCDIVGSTELTDRLGAEAMRDLVTAFIETSLAEVHRYDGSAPQFRGDGFMALFGAPKAHEDHVRRALLAALAIRRAVGSAGEVGGRGPLNLEVRIGIHTGPVAFGAIADNFRMETAIGDTPNVAARLEQLAEPGTIVVSEAVRAVTRGNARFEPLGPLVLKGKAEPVPAYRLLGVAQRPVLRDVVAPARATRFVGRERDLARLHRLLGRTEDGAGQAIGIVGEPGIGKSRLVAEFRRQLTDRRVTWVVGHCLSYGTQIPYLLALDLLRSNCRIVETDSAATITGKIRDGLMRVGMDPDLDSPVLLHLLGIKPPTGTPASAGPETVKARSFEVFRRMLIEGSRRRPVVLVLEDLQWIDQISGEWLALLAEDIAEARVMLLATYRPEYRAPWMGKAYGAQLPLPALSHDDSLKIVRSVLDGTPLAEPVAEEIVTRADGNPLFLEQLALHAGEMPDRRADPAVPDTISGVVMARIDRLPEARKRLLQTASVIGREFSGRLLSAVWPGEAPPEPDLDELCRLEFIDRRPATDENLYVFRHALTREAAYGSLLARDRRAGHAAIGRALEQIYEGRADEVAELLALHFGRSDVAEKAVDYTIRAAEKAQRRWANSDALAAFSSAVERLGAMPDTAENRLRRIDAVLNQAEVKYALGQYTEHIRALEEIRGIVDETPDPRRRAAWYYWTGFLHGTSGSRPEIAIEYCEEAARIAAAAGLDELDAFARSCLAQVYMVAGRLREALDAGERALASFEARGNRWWAGRTLWHLSAIANYLGEWDRSISYCERGLAHGVSLDDVRLKAASWYRLGTVHIIRGDVESGLRCSNEGMALSSVPRDLRWARVVRGYGTIRAGRTHEGIREVSEALSWYESSQMRWTHSIGAVWLAEGHLRGGNLADARSLIEHVLDVSRATGYLQFEARACWLMGECLATDDPAAAEGYIGKAIAIFERIGARNDLAKAAMTLAALRQRAGDAAAALGLLRKADGIFKALGTLDEPARVGAALAALDRGSPIRLLSDP